MHNVNERSQNCTSSNVGYADSLLTNYATEMTHLNTEHLPVWGLKCACI